MCTMLADHSESLQLPSHSLWYFAIPLVASVIAAISSWWIVRRYGDGIDRWLSGVAGRRFRFKTWISAIDILGIAVCSHGAGFEKIFAGEVTLVQAITVAVLCCLTAVFFAMQSLIHVHDVHADGRLAGAVEAHRKETEELRTRIEAMKADQEFGMACNQVFLGRIDKIKGRIIATVEAAEEQGRTIGIPGLISALDPNQMIKELVMIVYHIFDHQMSMRHGVIERTLRVALFRKNGSRLEHVFSWNGDTSNCVSSPIQSPDRFEMTQMLSCMAVASAWRSDVLVEEDAAIAHANTEKPFNYFGSGQWNTIRSIATLAMPMQNEQPPASYVMSIDASLKGFFKRDEIEKYRMLADNVARRLHLANTMERLLKNVSLEARKNNEPAKT